MKAELKLEKIETTKLGTEICHIFLTLRGKCDKELMGKDSRTFKLSSTRLSDMGVNSNTHSIKELRTLVEWLEEDDRKGISNNSKVRAFVQEKLDAHDTLNSEKIIEFK
tara:strand:+ start:223 stop:549 length:327 start_codon:yes stop_codon:yes gene_type:complete